MKITLNQILNNLELIIRKSPIPQRPLLVKKLEKIRKKVEGGFENTVNPLQFLARASTGGGGGAGGGNAGRSIASAATSRTPAPNLQAANPQTGGALSVASAQYSALSLPSQGQGNNVYNINAGGGGNQGALAPNMLPTGASAAGVGPGWFYQVAAARIS